jgi:hypothetical protein
VRQCEVSPPSHLRPDVPPELDTIVLRMLARDRLQRFAKGDEIAAALAPLTQAHDGSPEKLAELLARVWQADASEPIIEDKEDTETLDLEISHAPEEPAVAASPSVIVETGEVALPPRRPVRRARIALVGGGALLLAAAGLVGASMRSKPIQVPPAIIVKTVVAAPPPIAATPPPPPPLKAPAARITIELDVAAAQIWLDGKLVGDGVRRARVAIDRAGKHVIEVAAPRRRPYRRELVVADGADLDLRITLVRATSAFRRAKVRTTDGDYLVNPFGSRR